MKFKANYTPVSESMARTAKQVNSFSDYEIGSATATQKQYVDRIVQYAEEKLAKFPTDDTEKLAKVQEYIDRYSKKVAEAIDTINKIDGSCPSIMISGGSNFPTKKKEKQNQARDNYYEKYANIYNDDTSNYYYNKIYVLLADKAGIRSDDKNAIQKIKDKIAKLETLQDPYGNKKAEIRRLKERLFVLNPDEMKEGTTVTINGEIATYENIIGLFQGLKGKISTYCKEADEAEYYLSLNLVFSDGKRKYKEFLQIQVNEDCTEKSTYGDAKNNYQTIWKPLDEKTKFYLVINKIYGSGNKRIIYSILKDLDPEVQKQKEILQKQKENGEEIQKEISINGETVTVKVNEELVRLQLFFEGVPEKQTRELLKSNGFRWSPSQKAWQRLHNANAMHALKKITDK